MPRINLQFKFNIGRITGPLKRFIVKIPWFVARRSFVLFWVALVIIIGIDALIFYQYLSRVDKKEIKVETKQISIDDDSFNAFLKNYSVRKDIYNRGSIEIHNIFFR